MGKLIVSKVANTTSLADKFKNMDWLQQSKLIIVDNVDALRRMVQDLVNCKFVTYDVETTGLQIIDDTLVSMQFAGGPDEAYFIPLAMQGMNNMPLAEVIVTLDPIWQKGVVGHNIGYDWKMTQRFVDFKIEADTVLEAKLVPELWTTYQFSWDLKSLARGLFNLEVMEYKSLFPKRTPKKAMRFDLVDPEYGIPYACQDVLLTWMLHAELLIKYNIDREHFLYKLEHGILKVISRMELQGIGLNIDKLTEAEKVATALMEADQLAVNQVAGEEVLISSPKQIQTLLYEKLLLEAPKLTPSGDGGSTDAKTLEMLKGKHPVIDTLIHYRNIEKLRNAFLSKLVSFVQSDGCVHTSYNQYGAISGRFSSKKPNLQQVPKERDKAGDELRVAIRSSFVPPAPFIGLLDIDFSQIEYRIAASLAKDRGLIEAFLSGVDVHQKTAAMMYKVPLDQVTKAMRHKGKTANFAAIYGQGDRALAEQWGITLQEASAIMKDYWKAVPGLRRYCDHLREKARDRGYSETYFGRKRMHPNINHKAYALKGMAEREAVNAPIQGMAADILKLAILRCDQALEAGKFKSKMLLTVHDQLVFGHHPDDDLDALAEAMREAMEIKLNGFVPLETEAGYGPDWHNIESYVYPSRRPEAAPELPKTSEPAPERVSGLETTNPPSNTGLAIHTTTTGGHGSALDEGTNFIRLLLADTPVVVLHSVQTELNQRPGTVPVRSDIELSFKHDVEVDQKLLFKLKSLGIKYELGIETKAQVRRALLAS